MPGLKISILQQPLVWMDGPANLRHFDRQLEDITGRDVIVLPEMFTTGFAMEAAKQSLPQDELVVISEAYVEGHGTTVRFKPDEEIFEVLEFSYETLKKRFEELAYLNKGLSIAIADLRDDLYGGDEERMEENEKSYGQAVIVEAVFSSKSPIKLESI